MKRKLIITLCLSACIGVNGILVPNDCEAAGAGVFIQHYEAGQSYMEQGQYSNAIVEFRKALKINYLDNSARIGLINSYLARATYYANNEKNYEKAANDFRSALFYLKMYPTKEQTIQNSTAMISSATENLSQCLNVTGFDKTASSRYKKAEELKAMGNFSAAAYEFSQSARNEKLAGDSNIQIADLMKLLGNESRSVEYYKTALDMKPNDGLLRMKYARTLDRLGEYNEAVSQYNSALANSKNDMEILYALERIYLKKLAQTPSDAELNANIGAIKQAQGDFESALNYYGKAEQLNPNNVTTRLNVGTLYQQKKDYQRALKAYDSVLTLYPENTQANLYKAQVLSEMGDKANAMTYYKKVLSIEPENTIAKAELIDTMKASMAPEEFIKYLSQNSVNNKSMQTMLYDYSYKLHKDNKIQDAIQGYKAVIASDSTNVDAYVNLAVCYASLDDYQNAKSILNTAKAKFPSNNLIAKTLKEVEKDAGSAILANASASYENKDYNKAIEFYSSINPATEDSLLGIAASYQGLNDFNKAIDYYKKAQKISPKNAEIPYYIGYLYSELQNWKEAETYLKTAISMNPNSEAKDLLVYVHPNTILQELSDGIKLFEGNNFEGALVKFNAIIKDDVKNAYAYYYRAMIYDEQKKTQLAISDYLNVIKNTEEIPIAHYMLAVDYDGLENYKEAYKYYNQFISNYKTEDDYLNYAKSRVEELKPYVS